MKTQISLQAVLDTNDPGLLAVATHAPGPAGKLMLNADLLRDAPSGDIFGLSQNAGMGWNPANVIGPEYLILSTNGGLRSDDGSAVALGYHTGHWEVGLLVAEAARELKRQGAIPFAAAVTDPCDGRTQGTPGMFDSLPYRNDASIVFRRLIRSLPTRRGVIGVATCDKGLPAMMMALAATHYLPTILVPGGVTLLPDKGEDAGKVQSIGARFSHAEITQEYAEEVACHACASPGGGCQFLGTAATSQAVAEALGMSLPHTALAPSGHPIWLDAAQRSALALLRMDANSVTTERILTQAALRNAMVVHAAFGGSTNLLLHLPAVAHAAKLKRPTTRDWIELNRQVPRLVDCLPNGPNGFATVQVFLAGAVPEVMLHLREHGLLDCSVQTVSGESLDTCLNWWKDSHRRFALRRELQTRDGIDPAKVILSPDQAKKSGLTSTVAFPSGNLAPDGSVVKSTSIDASLVDSDNVYRKRGRARVFLTEQAAIHAIKTRQISDGDVLVLICGGPLGSGMQEIYQITSALKFLHFGKHIAVVTDARFSGVSTGACIGHVSPEALAGGPVGKLLDGDLIEIVIDREKLDATINLIGTATEEFGAEEGTKRLALRPLRTDLAPDPRLPDDTRLWAALTQASGGVWGGCVYDPNSIVERLNR